ncbi:nucleoside-diphosphate kinase [Amycolatopsis dendrobii]|uniref:Nucleoside diphosphate kinase-like domain-containing protein n=1 Tax=Amycolatopsis dendrobii TaxID=2760662 RepID=A0A7W3VYH7_9PSEU|nr:nucleoside-diphosphate kinase [Amycolatopsis dendrobii]MBB1155416.1 hypothetical protein [Amycolatopsis dendrobii]
MTDRWTFALITPDGVVGEAFDSIVELLQRNGFAVVTGRVLQLDLPTMMRVYRASETVDPENDPFARLYGSGAACLLLLHRAAGEACATLTRCKGATRPDAAQPGTVRYLGENVILNLLHSPDDPGNAARELSILVGQEAAERYRAEAMSGVLRGAAALRASLPATHGWEAISGPVAVNRIRRRIGQQFAPGDEGLQAALDDERDRIAVCRTSGERRLVAERANPSIQRRLTSLGLGELAGAPPDQAALAEHGIFVSKLEQLVLDTRDA